ncbi:uncharacterized protein LOC132720762 [Ruditapes philippinarum]|uniref:uncharacterized protein LOC132720762 n=1 Tax=Ruditapes philippinarum TaxID=129788 RepID=UPI00295B7F10|nr:uncharacterized protein LOC132720762 [Ruditapes philippinarum]
MIAFTVLKTFTGIFIFCVIGTKAQDCGGNEKFGKDNPDGKENLGLTDTYYMICDGDYMFDCCGVINRWEYTAEVVGSVELQVWRRQGGTDTYNLINSFSHTAGSANDQDFHPQTGNLKS